MPIGFVRGQPITKAVARVTLLLAANPVGGFLPRVWPGPERHHLRMREHLGAEIEIVKAQFAQDEARSFEDGAHFNLLVAAEMEAEKDCKMTSSLQFRRHVTIRPRRGEWRCLGR